MAKKKAANKGTFPASEIGVRAYAEFSKYKMQRDHEASRECIRLMRELKPDGFGIGIENPEGYREIRALWLTENLPGLSAERAAAKPLSPSVLVAWLKEIKRRRDSPAEPVAVEDEDPAPETSNSIDFASVHWYGTDYTFTPMQAACVKVLWQALKNRTPEVRGKSVVTEADESDGEGDDRLSAVFRGHPAWGTMIVSGSRRGLYRLKTPE